MEVILIEFSTDHVHNAHSQQFFEIGVLRAASFELQLLLSLVLRSLRKKTRKRFSDGCGIRTGWHHNLGGQYFLGQKGVVVWVSWAWTYPMKIQNSDFLMHSLGRSVSRQPEGHRKPMKLNHGDHFLGKWCQSPILESNCPILVQRKHPCPESVQRKNIYVSCFFQRNFPFSIYMSFS